MDTVPSLDANRSVQDDAALYRTLFNAIDESVSVIELLYDAAGKPVDYLVLAANPAFQQVTGLPDPVGRTVRELVPSLEDAWIATFARIAATGVPERFVQEVHELGRWYETYAFRLGSPELHRVAVISTDATARMQTELALRESEARWQDLLRASADAVYRMSPDWTRMEMLQGQGFLADTTAPSEFWLDAYIDPADQREIRTAIQQAIRAKAVFELEHRVRRSNGTLGWTHSRAVPRLDADGNIVEWIGAATDVTARKQFEAALRASEEQLRQIVEQATDYAIFTTDLARRIETWSPGATNVFGWTAAEAIGELVDFTFTPEDRAAGVPAQETDTARREGSAPNVRWHQRKDGGQVFIDGVAQARYDENGAVAGIVKIGQDTTERHLADERRRADAERQRAQLEAAVAAATTDLRALSRRLLTVQESERRHLARELHDEIGQLLTGLGFQLASAEGRGGTAALAEARDTVRQLTEQVRQLSMDLRPQTLDQFGLATAVEALVAGVQQRTGLRIDLAMSGIDGRLPPDLEIAAYRITQEALTNIVRHAEARLASVRLVHLPDALLLTIEDDGQGFDPASVSPNGLRGMEERAALLDGTFSVATDLGAGTTVTATLPLPLPPPQAAPDGQVGR